MTDNTEADTSQKYPDMISQWTVEEPGFHNEMAAAHLALAVNRALNIGFYKSTSPSFTAEESSARVDEIAAGMNVSSERVIELMNKEGNLMTSSLARLLSAMGYTLEIQLYKETIAPNGRVTKEVVPEFIPEKRTRRKPAETSTED